MLPPKNNNPLLNLAVFLLAITLAVADSSPTAAFQQPLPDPFREITINDIDIKDFPKISINLTLYPPLDVKLEDIQRQIKLYEDGSEMTKPGNQPQLHYKEFTTIFILDIQGTLQHQAILRNHLCKLFTVVRHVSFKSLTTNNAQEGRGNDPHNCKYNVQANIHSPQPFEVEWTDQWVICIDKSCSPFLEASVTFPNELLDEIFPEQANQPFSTPSPSENQSPAEVSTDLDSLLFQSLRHTNPFLIIIRYDLDNKDLYPYIPDRIAQEIRSRQIPLALYNITQQDTSPETNDIIQSEIKGLNGHYIPSNQYGSLETVIPSRRTVSWEYTYDSQLFPDRKPHFVYLTADIPDTEADLKSQVKEFLFFPTPYPITQTSLSPIVTCLEKILPLVLLIIPILILVLIK